jgi:Na+/H+-dicarboxylate symporter/ABC-type amino acid transport substrate-binding protein
MKLKPKLSLATLIIVAMILGILCGLTFGERCRDLSIIGNVYITLLQMCVLPYVVLSILYGIGKLSFSDAKMLALKGGIMIFIFWSISILFVLLLPLTFPNWTAASFFSTSIVALPPKMDYLNLYIPANPFNAMANNLVPAVTLFCICVGVALIGMKDKQVVIDSLGILTGALGKVTNTMVKLTPIGTFAIVASAAGTMTIEEFGRIQVYFITFIVASLIMTFCIFPLLVSAFTPFKYRDILSVSKDALLTAFTTGNLFILLPMISNNLKELLENYNLNNDTRESMNDIIIPICYNFPNAGKLLALLFVMFAAWFDGVKIGILQYPDFISSGLLSFFGSTNSAMPFLLSHFQISSDLFEIYLVSGVINGKFATLLAAIYLLCFTLLTTAWLTKMVKFNPKKLFINITIMVVVTAVALIGTKITLKTLTKNNQDSKEVLASMVIKNKVESVVSKKYPKKSAWEEILSKHPGKNRLEMIQERGVLKIGYNLNTRPFTYFNAKGELVGFDIAIAHKLAKDIKCTLKFIPMNYYDIKQGLNAGVIDIAMAGISKTLERIEKLNFTEPYMNINLAFVTHDYKLDDYRQARDIALIKNIKIAILKGSAHRKFVEKRIPQGTFIDLENIEDFFNGKVKADVLLTSAEQGSAWAILYPSYGVVVPRPNIHTFGTAYAIAKGDLEFNNFLNEWLRMQKNNGVIKQLYSYWILGQNIKPKEPRWNLWDNVIHPPAKQ